MPQRYRLVLALLVLSMYGVLSCSEDPARVGRPPVVEGFSPSDQDLSAFTGDTLVFSIRAMDPDDSRLRQQFTLGDSVVSNGAQWEYIVEDTGMVTIECKVTDGEHRSWIQWDLLRMLRVNNPPVIASFSPVESNPTMIVNTELEFEVDAVDPDGDILAYSFYVDEVYQNSAERFLFTATEIGTLLVKSVVTDGELFASREWDLAVTAVPDTTPPAEVLITLLVTGAEPGEVDLEWMAVGQNGMEGEASNYLVRTSPDPVVTDDDWVRASEHPNTPNSVPAGQTMSMTIGDLTPGRFTHVTVRALDDFGNLSPIGQSPGTYTRGMRIGGVVRDALTGETIPNVTVKLAHFTTMADAFGTFEFIELPPVDGGLSFLDETEDGVIGAYFDYATMYEIVHNDFLDVVLIPNRTLTTGLYANLYEFYRSMTDIPGNRRATEQRRWELPIDLYVPAFSSNGLDYRATIVAAAAEFDAILDTPVFNIVTDIPEKGVQVVFDSDVYSDNYRVLEWTADSYPQKARIKFRTHYAPATVVAFRTIVRHELGHALGLQHSIDSAHLMVGSQVAGSQWFTDDELMVIELLYEFPRGHEMRDHLEE